MTIPMWLLVLLILFASLGVWALIFAFKLIGMLVKISLVQRPIKKDDQSL